MFSIFKLQPFSSKLFNETTFYPQFIADISKAKKEIIIESPFITSSRMEKLYPILQKILSNKIQINIITRDPSEYDDEFMQHQATNEILQSFDMGIQVKLITGYHHRKLAMIDQQILWEGSLNILSFSNSQEIMRRINSEQCLREMKRFISILY